MIMNPLLVQILMMPEIWFIQILTKWTQTWTVRPLLTSTMPPTMHRFLDDPNASLTSQSLNPDGTPKRPMNAFMIFARRRRPQVSAENQSMRTGEISKILSREWNVMDTVGNLHLGNSIEFIMFTVGEAILLGSSQTTKRYLQPEVS